MKDAKRTTMMTGALAIGLLLALPGAMGDHDPNMPGGADPAEVLPAMATNGYVIMSEQTDDGYDVRVLHADANGIGDECHDVAGNGDISGGNTGAWFHDLEGLEQGTHLDQTVIVEQGDEDCSYMSIELSEDPGASGLGSIIFVVPIETEDGSSWISGFHNDVKSVVALSALDAVPSPVML